MNGLAGTLEGFIRNVQRSSGDAMLRGGVMPLLFLLAAYFLRKNANNQLFFVLICIKSDCFLFRFIDNAIEKA